MQACSANHHQVIMPSWLPKVPSWLRKNALCLSETAFSNFALHVIMVIKLSWKIWKSWVFECLPYADPLGYHWNLQLHKLIINNWPWSLLPLLCHTSLQRLGKKHCRLSLLKRQKKTSVAWPKPLSTSVDINYKWNKTTWPWLYEYHFFGHPDASLSLSLAFVFIKSSAAFILYTPWLAGNVRKCKVCERKTVLRIFHLAA